MTDIRKVLVLYTGGTIGMKKNEDGVYVPEPGVFIEYIKTLVQLCNNSLNELLNLEDNQLALNIFNKIVIYQIEEYNPLLDSSNISAREWITMGGDLEKNYNDFHGFIILHGTDTLTYSASALSFMLDGLAKPVILTGAQVPIFEEGTDAIENFYYSLMFASCYNVPEVCIFFFKKLMRGNRSVKVDCTGYDAFDSPNLRPLASIIEDHVTNEIEIFFANELIQRKKKGSSLKVKNDLNSNVGILYISPTITGSHIETFIRTNGLGGVVIVTFGSGNVPSNDETIVDTLRELIQDGVVIINVTQCLKGSVRPDYETGNVLAEAGVIEGYDITKEAALTKLIVFLQNSSEFFRMNVKGEMTIN